MLVGKHYQSRRQIPPPEETHHLCFYVSACSLKINNSFLIFLFHNRSRISFFFLFFPEKRAWQKKERNFRVKTYRLLSNSEVDVRIVENERNILSLFSIYLEFQIRLNFGRGFRWECAMKKHQKSQQRVNFYLCFRKFASELGCIPTMRSSRS